MKDFFISYNRHDKQWAEWIAWTLEEAGYSVVIQAWDFRPGGNFALDMQRASAECEKTIAVLSANYLTSEYTQSEWGAAFAGDPLSLKRKLIPMRVGECRPEGVLKTIVYVDLVGVTATEAKDLVLGALKERAKPAQEPVFPGVVSPKAERTEPEPVAFPEPSTPAPATPTIPTFSFDVVTVNAQGQQISRRKGQAQYFTEDLGQGVKLELVAIPSGVFRMGSPVGEEGRDWYKNFDETLTDPEGPQHQVSLPSFWLGRYPVTQSQWRIVATLPQVQRELQPDPSKFKGDHRPVEQVSWFEAVEFCERLSRKTGRQYRLPSEAEWEYACRAGTTTPFHYGDTITTDLANYRGTDWDYKGKTYPGFYGQGPRGVYREQTTNVSGFPPNAFGLYDMHGNVWEWCLDYWHNNYQEAPTDGSAWIAGSNDKYRLLRGGSWDVDPTGCRSATRNWDEPDSRYSLIGFRVVCASAWTL